jgi:hypothetical protein
VLQDAADALKYCMVRSTKHARHLGTTTGNTGPRKRPGGHNGGSNEDVSDRGRVTIQTVQGSGGACSARGGTGMGPAVKELWEREQDTTYVGNRPWRQEYPTSREVILRLGNLMVDPQTPKWINKRAEKVSVKEGGRCVEGCRS